MDKINIAIDGPAGSGKSTVAIRVAENLSYLYIDTGAMYRALTYEAILAGVVPSNETALMNLLDRMELSLSSSGSQLLVNGEPLGDEIRSNSVTNAVSEVSAHRAVREEMVRQQQKLARLKGVVLDGRDIGTHVLPDAEVKVYLFASPEERAKRRHLENRERGQASNIDTIKSEIVRRDHLDTTREFAPLKQADDAYPLDTTDMTIDEVVSFIHDRAKEKENSTR